MGTILEGDVYWHDIVDQVCARECRETLIVVSLPKSPLEYNIEG